MATPWNPDATDQDYLAAAREPVEPPKRADGVCRHCGWLGKVGEHHPKYKTPQCGKEN